ncbi:lipopolysaccharide assembly protein LapA domain-containing protein [Cellulomonas sp.]|uniref:LapA family protein n=1 Tax=Cellulomonas sp. TaxID=40001 RepID=UPI0025909820|nr:lipopolysaccharide assembly protein LapA domain-containing protein [Cellulomonas sp.]MCR6688862.1 lipopolysaccharide assembly protein LapA domain-containing protein [Cellulomonas sp.]
MRSRTGAAWVGVCVGVLVLIALVVFMMQNTTPVEVTFLGMSGSAPLALVLLIAGIGVGLIALVIGSLRIGQLRRRIRSDRQAASGSTL